MTVFHTPFLNQASVFKLLISFTAFLQIIYYNLKQFLLLFVKIYSKSSTLEKGAMRISVFAFLNQIILSWIIWVYNYLPVC